MNIVRVRTKGQVTLPLSARKAIQVDAGDYLVCELKDDCIVLRKARIYQRASFNDGIWQLVGSCEDKEGRTDISTNKHEYLGDKR